MKFFSRKKQATCELKNNNVRQIILRLGIVSPFTLSAVLLTLPESLDDEGVLQALVSRKIMTTEQVERVKEVKQKAQEGHPVYEAWAKLEMSMAESKKCADELSAVIAERKKLRRSRGEDTTFFATQKKLSSAT